MAMYHHESSFLRFCLRTNGAALAARARRRRTPAVAVAHGRPRACRRHARPSACQWGSRDPDVQYGRRSSSLELRMASRMRRISRLGRSRPDALQPCSPGSSVRTLPGLYFRDWIRPEHLGHGVARTPPAQRGAACSFDRHEQFLFATHERQAGPVLRPCTPSHQIIFVMSVLVMLYIGGQRRLFTQHMRKAANRLLLMPVLPICQCCRG